jgi:hypothetical protein
LIFACVGGTLERGSPPSLGGGFSCEREATSKARTKTRQVHRQARTKAKKMIMIKTKQARGRKAHQGKGRLTSQGLWESLRGTSRHQRVVAIVLGSLVYVSCVVLFALRPSIYICSKLVFPMGGCFQGHVDQKSVSNLCMLRSVDQHFKVQDLEVVLCVLMYIACANIE